MRGLTFHLKKKLFQLALHLLGDRAAWQKAIKDAIEEDKSHQRANFENKVDILHLLLWLSNLKREQAVLDARSHAVERSQLYQRDRVVSRPVS